MTLPEHVLLKRRLATPVRTGTTHRRNTREDASLDTSLREDGSPYEDISREGAPPEDTQHEDTWVTNFVARLAGLVRQIGNRK